MKTTEQAWAYLAETGLATEEELRLVTCINGYNIETMERVLYVRTACRSFERMEDWPY